MITELNKRPGPEWAGRAIEKLISSYRTLFTEITSVSMKTVL
jgi:hypothetical protein